ncbi:MAG: hypothetical protein Q7R85_00120 [bacterium]|nr:hypothetical protein [bacterium]
MDNLPSNLNNLPPKSLANNQPSFPPRPIPPPLVPPRPTPPPPPPMTRDFQHVAPVAPSGMPSTVPTPMAPSEMKTPPPPGPEVRIRSLTSDAETLSASGGAGAEAKKIRLEDLDDETPVFAPGTIGQLPDGVAISGNPSGKLIAIIGGSIVGVVVLGLLGYYVVYPLIFTPQAPEPEPVVTPRVSAPQPLPHVSLFPNPLPSQAQLDLPSITAEAIMAATVREVTNHTAPHVMDELAVFSNGGQVPFGDFLNALVPELAANTIKDLIADDFSGFAYFDNNGHWPGYVAALKPSAIPSDAQTTFARLESANLAPFYIEDPGAKGEFKAGQVNGVPTRYATFTKPGASFNYGIFGNYLIISTSFNGLKAILPFLGM